MDCSARARSSSVFGTGLFSAVTRASHLPSAVAIWRPRMFTEHRRALLRQLVLVYDRNEFPGADNLLLVVRECGCGENHEDTCDDGTHNRNPSHEVSTAKRPSTALSDVMRRPAECGLRDKLARFSRS